MSLNSASASPEEPSLYRPRKQPRHTSLAVCPTALSLYEGSSDDRSAYHVTDSIMHSPHYTPSTEDESCTDLECDLFPSQCTILGDTIDPVVPRDFNDDIMFDQYLRSPSPSPSPSPSTPLSADDADSELTGVTLINTERYQRGGSEEPSRESSRELARVDSRSRGPEHAPEKQEAGYQEEISHLNSGPRIRLRVNRPRITLRLTLLATRQAGVKERKREKRKTKGRGS